jgi:hypothetical protein
MLEFRELFHIGIDPIFSQGIHDPQAKARLGLVSGLSPSPSPGVPRGLGGGTV